MQSVGFRRQTKFCACVLSPRTIFLALALLVSGFVRGAPTAGSQQPTATPTAKARGRQLVILNVTQDTARLELRLGNAPNCGSALGKVLLLPPGRRWLIASERPMCWRRTDAHALSAADHLWHRHVLAKGQELVVKL